MLVWINGAFGAGKTTVARRLAATLPGARLFDPEQIGFLLRRLFPDAATGDFQDLALWRELTVRTLTVAAAEPGKIPIVPMTLIDRDYFREIVGGLRSRGIDVRHFCLVASPDTLRRRIRWRIDRLASKRWARSRIQACTAARADQAFATHVQTDRIGIRQVAAEILAALEDGECAAAGRGDKAGALC